MPDSDGRDAPTSAFDVVLIVLFPVRVVVDYGVRRPFGWLVQKAEHSARFRRFVRDLFREIKGANPLIFPVVLVDFRAPNLSAMASTSHPHASSGVLG